MPTERLQVTFARTIAGYTEDPAVITIHFQSATGTLLTDPIRQAVEGHFQTFWGAFSSRMPAVHALDQYRWYDQQVWPTKSPLLRANDIVNVPGTATASQFPPQLSISCTLATATRARWGRFYMPPLTNGELASTNGRLITSVVDTLATALQTFLQAAKTAGAVPVVWSPRGGAGPPAFSAGATLPVTSCRIDDIYDIVRSRRWQSGPYRKILPVA